MALPINPITSPVVTPAAAAVKPQAANPFGSFASVLSEAVNNVNQVHQTANDSVERFLTGENEEVHDMVMATQRDELTFQLFLQVRNKVVDAYQEVMRMQM